MFWNEALPLGFVMKVFERKPIYQWLLDDLRASQGHFPDPPCAIVISLKTLVPAVLSAYLSHAHCGNVRIGFIPIIVSNISLMLARSSASI
jgi:hypothetical protein